MNNITTEVLGKSDIVAEDLSNVVDIGNEIFDTKNVDNYVRKLIDRIGKVVFVNRPYSGSVPSVLMDGWEYGSVLEKISMDSLPEAKDNDSWNLQNGHSYDPNVFNGPTASAKFFNNLSTYEINMSFAERQVKSAFTSASQLNAFFSMIETAIQNSMTIKIDGLVMGTIDSMIAHTFDDGNTNRCVNLLQVYNATKGGTLTASKAIYDPEFIRFCAYLMGQYAGRMSKLSTLFNIGQKERFTPNDRLHIVLLDQFAQAADVYLQSDTYHNEFTKLPNAEKVPYWQGSGTSYAFNDVSEINIGIKKTPEASTATMVNKTGIVGVMFDRESLGVCNQDRRVTTNYNPRGEFYNNWYKFDCGYFNDLNENFVVFYIADAA